jgi:uncharacterized protein YgiB involved in biofilm formation
VSRNVRVLMLAFLLLAVVALNVSAAVVAEPAAPVTCYDIWQNCLKAGNTAEQCEWKWRGCMCALYGTHC